MKTEITDRILSLAKQGENLSYFINNKLPNIRKRFRDEKDRLDKHTDGFAEDGDAIQSFNIRLSYKSFSGLYGSSSTYSDFTPDNEIMRKYFLKYLNKHTKEIFNEIADMIAEDVVSMKKNALKELDEKRTLVEKLLSNC